MKRSPKLTTEQMSELNGMIQKGNGGEVRKCQAVLLVNQESNGATIGMLTGYTEKHAYKLRRSFLHDGIDAIKDKRVPKPRRRLTKTERAAVVETIKTRRPCELGSYYQHYGYWTTAILGAYIKRTYGVEYKSKTSEYLLFKEAKFTYHKPGKVSEKRNEAEVQEWRRQATKRIAAVWNDPNVVILTEDEMHLSNQTTIQKIQRSAAKLRALQIPAFQVYEEQSTVLL
jgi:transposase